MQTGNRYSDRVNAGQSLASHLLSYAGRPDVVVIGLPRGGVIVAAEVAIALHAPLDIFPVKKLGAPAQPEFGIGALGGNGVQVLDERLVREFGLSPEELEEVIAAQEEELRQQENFFRSVRPMEPLADRIAIIVDDGAATGYTLIAAAAGVRSYGPAHIVIAVPVGAAEACEQFEEIADEVICPLQPTPFHAVGLWYGHFEQVGSEEAVARLVAANQLPSGRRD